MATRDVIEGRLDVFWDHLKDGQDEGRALGRWGRNYGQVLRGNGRPSDQPANGPQLPANLKDDAWIDVYEAPNGFGFSITGEADDGGTKTYTCHENGDVVKGPWIDKPEEIP